MEPLTDHNSFDGVEFSSAIIVVAVAAAAIGIREIAAAGSCFTDERSASCMLGPLFLVGLAKELILLLSSFSSLVDILLLTLYNQLWEIFSTFLFLVDDTDK